MNYVSVVYFVVIVIIVMDWFFRGRHEYRGQATRHEEVEVNLARRESVIRTGSVAPVN